MGVRAGRDLVASDLRSREKFGATLEELLQPGRALESRVVRSQLPSEAIAILDSLSAERPREPQARFMKGVALTDSGKTDAAISLYLALLADFPELPEVRNNLAVLYAQKGNYAGARDELEAALLAAPDYTIAYENLGDVYARRPA
jgi:Flp pilus assembly protein TadD